MMNALFVTTREVATGDGDGLVRLAVNWLHGHMQMLTDNWHRLGSLGTMLMLLMFMAGWMYTSYYTPEEKGPRVSICSFVC